MEGISRIYLQNVTLYEIVDCQNQCFSSIKIKLTESKMQPNTRDSNILEMCIVSDTVQIS